MIDARTKAAEKPLDSTKSRAGAKVNINSDFNHQESAPP